MKKRGIYNKAILIVCFVGFTWMASGQELAYFIDKAIANNPGLQAYKVKYEIANEAVKETEALPNTEFGFGYFVSEPETRTGAQKARISLKQMLPWFGTITARENYAASLAETTYQELVIMQRKLVLSVSQSYYNLYTIRAKENVINEKLTLLKTYEELALTALEVGQASAVDILKLQIRKNELKAQVEILQKQFEAEKSVLVQLMNLKELNSVNFPLTLDLPEEDMLQTNDSLWFHPELETYEKLYNSVEKSILLNQKEANPAIGFGLDYIAVAERPDQFFNDNGKDIFMPMVSLSIPLFNNSYRSKSKQLDLRKKEIKSLQKERRNMLEMLLTKAFQQRERARTTCKTQDQNLKHARDAEEILLKTYENGSISFTDVLEIQELQLEFLLKKLDAVASYFVASANINYLIGNSKK
ncbi:TolC family protein [Flavobacteriaceae bacterium M23B6Z8]